MELQLKVIQRKLIAKDEEAYNLKKKIGCLQDANTKVKSYQKTARASRAQVADPQTRRKRGYVLSPEGVKSLAVGYIQQKLSIAAVKAQSLSLLGRLEGLGPSATTAAGRRAKALEQDRLWACERRAHQLATNIGFSFNRREFAKLD